MGDLQDKVNERHDLTEEEFAEQQDFAARELALQNLMNDSMIAMERQHQTVVKERKAWWNRKIEEKKLNVAELVYGIEFHDDRKSATIVVVDVVKKPTPQDQPSAVRKHLKVAPDVPEA